MPDTTQQTNPESYNVITNSNKKNIGKKGILVGLVILLFLILSIVAGVFLVRQQQNLENQASVLNCPGAQACPVAGQPNLLRNCSPGNSDGSPVESNCSNTQHVGRIVACGSYNYCCPTLGASWTADLSLCDTATATPVSTLAPTATASATPVITASASATPRTQTTSRPIPVTGSTWPTIIGGVIGIGVIIGAILLAI